MDSCCLAFSTLHLIFKNVTKDVLISALVIWLPLLFATENLIHHLTTILDQIDWEEPCDDFKRKIIFSFTSNNTYFSTLWYKKIQQQPLLFVIFNNTTQFLIQSRAKPCAKLEISTIRPHTLSQKEQVSTPALWRP